jgi:hypothetical protein
MKKFFFVFRTGALIMFSIILWLEIYLLFTNFHAIRKLSLMFVIVFLIVFALPKKLSWIVGLYLFSWGLYNALFVNIWAAEPTIPQFTSPLFYLIPNEFRHGIPVRVLRCLPDLFYLMALAIFLTTPARQFYAISRSAK